MKSLRLSHYDATRARAHSNAQRLVPTLKNDQAVELWRTVGIEQKILIGAERNVSQRGTHHLGVAIGARVEQAPGFGHGQVRISAQTRLSLLGCLAATEHEPVAVACYVETKSDRLARLDRKQLRLSRIGNNCPHGRFQSHAAGVERESRGGRQDAQNRDRQEQVEQAETAVRAIGFAGSFGLSGRLKRLDGHLRLIGRIGPRTCCDLGREGMAGAAIDRPCDGVGSRCIT